MALRHGVCQQCGEAFSRALGGTRDTMKFCSRSCSATHRNRVVKRVRVQHACPSCGVTKPPGYSRSSLCSVCSDAYHNGGQARTMGELRAKYSTHQFHAKVRGLARSSFQGPLVCIVCGYSLHVDVCHVRPVVDFEADATIAEVNNPSNLVTLCPNHHWEFDNGHLPSLLSHVQAAAA